MGPPWPGTTAPGPLPTAASRVLAPTRPAPRDASGESALAAARVSVPGGDRRECGCHRLVYPTGIGEPRGSGAGGSQVSADGEIASAGDTGPVGIITEDPTCERLLKMQNQAASQLADWGNRDAAVPASEWTPEQRQMYDTAARILHAEADQLIPLARDTPHRVMRELYEQVIAYDRAYANAIPNYSPSDDDLAVVRNGLGAAQMNICLAIDSYAATNRAPSVQTAAPPTTIAPVGDPGKPQRFLAAPSDACRG